MVFLLFFFYLSLLSLAKHTRNNLRGRFTPLPSFVFILIFLLSQFVFFLLPLLLLISLLILPFTRFFLLQQPSPPFTFLPFQPFFSLPTFLILFFFFISIYFLLLAKHTWPALICKVRQLRVIWVSNFSCFTSDISVNL